MQLSLLDRTTPDRSAGPQAAEPELTWARWRHIDLGQGAWLEVARGWIPDQAELFAQLGESADWEHHERRMYERVVAVPRLVASCPGTEVASPWTGETAVQVLPHRASAERVRRSALRLRQLQDVLTHRYGRSLRSISLSLYRDGMDSVAFHGDKLGALRQDTVVAIASLGAARHFLLRRAPSCPGPLPQSLLTAGVGAPRGRGPEHSTFALSVGEGDLLVMGGTCQETWEHAVPKQSGAGPRIAVMFRERADEAEGAGPAPGARFGGGPSEGGLPEGGLRNVRGPRRLATPAAEPARAERGRGVPSFRSTAPTWRR
jgi:alkylated DNA repair dioxygenase AlkB